MATLVRYTGLSDHTVRTCLDRLKTEGIIRPCDPDIVAARIKRADRRPKGWDLDLTQIRADLTQTEVTTPDRQPAAGPRGPQRSPARMLARLRAGATRARTGCNPRSHGVQQLYPNHPGNHPWNRPPLPRVRARQRPRTAKRLAANPPGTSSPPWAAAGGLPQPSSSSSPPAVTTAWTRDGRRMRWRLSPERTPPAYTAPTRSWPLGSHPVNCPRRLCDRRGRPGAASATRPPGCSTSTATRRAPARAANRRHARRRTGRSRRPSPPRSPSGAEGQHGCPHGLEARRAARAPGKTARRHRRPGPSPHSPIMMITDGERIPRHPPCRSRAYGDHLRGSWRDAPIASSADSGAAGKALLPVSRACIRINGRS